MEIFTHLADKLAAIPNDVIDRAICENEWFTRADIERASEALRSQMLDPARLREWLAHYPSLPVQTPRNVGVIMAGNIPLVGFFDLLCVVASGHRCFSKPSSKDSVLMRYVAEGLPAVEEYDAQPLDAVIATGSDNTTRYFRSSYAGIPSIIRGSRSSVAVLRGGETATQIDALSRDIFAYSGLGCRSVSHLLLQRGRIDVAALASRLVQHGLPNPKYHNNYLQHKALLCMSGTPFIDGGFFLMRETSDFPTAISEITYQYYDYLDYYNNSADQWLATHSTEIQCIVGATPHLVPFGMSQSPTLIDYPDGVDVMDFLSKI